jgi:phage terminase large subunit-like protein
LELTVEQDLRECHRRGNCAAIVADPYQMHGSIMRLQKAGLPIRELNQSQASTTQFSQALFDAIRGKNLRMYVAPELREMALNAVALETPRGFRLAKERTSRKVDGVVALAMAIFTAIEEGARSRTSAAVVMPSATVDLSWQDRYFGIRPKADPLARWGLVPAPKREQMSDAMRELLEQNEREDAAARRYDDVIRGPR